MATRSTIAIEFADNSVSQVYCHWDGYLENNGAILAEHYMDPFKVRDLVDLGDFSSLRETVEDTKEGAYHFSRDEEFCVRRYQNADEYFADCQQEEYDYILRQVEGKPVWFVRFYATEGKWVTLAEAVATEQKIREEECY